MSFSAVFDLSTLDGSNGFKIQSVGPGYLLHVSSGDLNNDGIGDILVGLPYIASDAGLVVYGTTAARPAIVSQATLSGPNGFRILEGADTREGQWMAVGDFDNDGFDDLLVSANDTTYLVLNLDGQFGDTLDLSAVTAPEATRLIHGANSTSARPVGFADFNGDGFADLITRDPANLSVPGHGIVVFGTAAGLPAQLAPSGLDGQNGFRLSTIPAYELNLVSAGDVNNDGFDDLLFSNNNYSIGTQGTAGVIFGKAGGYAAYATPATDGVQGFEVDTHGDKVTTLASAGDLNNDGFDDFAFAGPTANAGAGAVYVVFGTGAAYPALLDLAGLDGVNGFKLTGLGANRQAGASVSSAGDVNDDGYDDLIIGSRGDNADAFSESYVVYGKAYGYDPVLSLSSLDGTDGFIIRGPNYSDSRTVVTGLGDINGDGVDDIGIAESLIYTYFQPRPVYVIYGQASPRTFAGTAGADAYNGGAAGDTISGLGGDDTLSGLAGDDSIDGGDGDDLLDGGSGRDVLLGGLGDDELLGGDNGDLLQGGAGVDELDGGAGGDVLYGDAGVDTMNGGADGDKLFGGDGGDRLSGGDGNDRLDGGADTDQLAGGEGNDYLDGGADSTLDILYGGAGNDVYIVGFRDSVQETADAGYDVVRSSQTYSLLTNIEALELLGSADIDGSGNGGANNLQGNSGNNLLEGRAGVDTINGGDGDDVIVGGLGNDLLRGGLGADVFRVAYVATGALETDQVYDFSAAEADTLDLSGAYAGTLELVSTFGKHAGEMTLTFASGITTLRLDLNGDGRVDYQMKLNGDLTGESGDWLL